MTGSNEYKTSNGALQLHANAQPQGLPCNQTQLIATHQDPLQ